MARQFKRALVTGGGGYVGSSLVPKLLNAGYEVTVLDLYIYGDVFAHLGGNPALTQVKGDLRNPQDVRRALTGCDAVIHLGGVSVERPFEEVLEANIKGVYNLYEGARRHGRSAPRRAEST